MKESIAYFTRSVNTYFPGYWFRKSRPFLITNCIFESFPAIFPLSFCRFFVLSQRKALIPSHESACFTLFQSTFFVVFPDHFFYSLCFFHQITFT